MVGKRPGKRFGKIPLGTRHRYGFAPVRDMAAPMPGEPPARAQAGDLGIDRSVGSAVNEAEWLDALQRMAAPFTDLEVVGNQIHQGFYYAA
jgi:hypothetical protein